MAAVIAGRRQSPAFRQHRDPRRAQKLHIPHQPVAAPMPAAAAGTPPQRVPPQPQREGELQRLHRRVHRVRHMGVDARHAVLLRARPHAAADGFVIHIGPVAGNIVAPDDHIVHRPLGRGGNPFRQGLAHGRQQHIRNPLGGLHIAAGHAPLGARIHQAARLRNHPHRTQTALVGRRFVPHHAPHHIQAGRHRNRPGRIDAARTLRGRSRKVNGHPVPGHRNRHADRHRLLGLPVVVHIIGDAIHAVGNLRNRPPGQPFRIVQQGVHMRLRIVRAVAFRNFRQPLLPHPDGGDLRRQIPLPVVGRAGVAADERHHFLIDAARRGQLQRRNNQPFLVQLRGQGHRPRRHSAHIGMMPPVAHIANQAAAVVAAAVAAAAAIARRRRAGTRPGGGKANRRHQGNVGQMRTAQVGVIEDDNIPGAQPLGEGFQRRLHGSGHRPQMHRLVRRLRHHLRRRAKERAGKILPLLHIRRVAGALQRHAHLLRNGDEHILEHFQTDGVNRHNPAAPCGVFSLRIVQPPAPAGQSQSRPAQSRPAPALA